MSGNYAGSGSEDEQSPNLNRTNNLITTHTLHTSSSDEDCQRQTTTITTATTATATATATSTPNTEALDELEQRLMSFLEPSKPHKEFLQLEYDPASKICSSQVASSQDTNKPKNRYANVVPYDLTRVKLREVNGSDYINASFIDGEVSGSNQAYIATQGPLPETFADFWRMTWETSCRLIVMLTREREQSMIKVDRYWPTMEEKVVKYGVTTVVLVEEHDSPESAIKRRIFQLSHSGFPGETRIVEQYQYSGWPDHGVPNTTEHIRTLIRCMSRSSFPSADPYSHIALPKPTIVHCSAGIGRTGTFCAIHISLEKLYHYCNNSPLFGATFKATGSALAALNPEDIQQRYSLVRAATDVLRNIDIYSTVKNLRLQRPGMVQQQEQYSFSYYAVQDEMVQLGLIPEHLCDVLKKTRMEKDAPLPPQPPSAHH